MKTKLLFLLLLVSSLGWGQIITFDFVGLGGSEAEFKASVLTGSVACPHPKPETKKNKNNNFVFIKEIE